MSDALQTILADPELRDWPHRGPAAPTASAAEELAPPPFTPPRLLGPAPAAAALFDPFPEITEPLTTAVTAAAYRPATAPDNTLLNPTAHPAALDRIPDTAPDLENPYYPPRDNTPATAAETADGYHDADATNSAHPPMSFDEIMRHRNPLTDKFGHTAEWLKNNWRNPKVAMTATAVIVTAVSLTAWASTGTGLAPQPTATITTPSSGPTTDPTPAAPADAPLPVKNAEARCPAPSSDPMNAVTPGGGQPWTCVQAWGIDGQVLTLDLGGPAVISAVAIVPGANNEVAGEDQWGRYRTLKRLTWTFNDANHTKITQCPDSRRDLVTQPLAAPDCVGYTPRGPVVASQVQLTIEKTVAPPSAPAGGGIGVSPVTSDGTSSDISSVFAVSRIQVIGHSAN